mmetsp:Transcript_26605/g.72232  ORF Transcript_26605/g.72232 Transcript_26605/m.72232 type:complete len:210 (+) Transcript_26605:244-873(+)
MLAVAAEEALQQVRDSLVQVRLGLHSRGETVLGGWPAADASVLDAQGRRHLRPHRPHDGRHQEARRSQAAVRPPRHAHGVGLLGPLLRLRRRRPRAHWSPGRRARHDLRRSLDAGPERWDRAPQLLLGHAHADGDLVGRGRDDRQNTRDDPVLRGRGQDLPPPPRLPPRRRVRLRACSEDGHLAHDRVVQRVRQDPAEDPVSWPTAGSA